MSGGAPYQKPGFDFRDLDPHLDPQGHVATSFRARRTALTRYQGGAEGAGEIQMWRYRQPQGRARHLVESPTDPTQTALLPSAARDIAFSPGQRVAVAVGRSGATILGNPAGGDQGLSEHDIQTRTKTADVFGIDTASPETVDVGAQAVVVSLSGYGFQSSPDDVFTPVVFDEATLTWITDTLITVTSTTIVSATQADLTINVSASAPPGHLISFRVERG